MSDDVRDGVASAFEEATRAVLGESLVAFERADSSAPALESKPHVFAAIGFAGAIRGTMIMIANDELIRAMSPSDVREQMTSEAVTQDVFGELANLTLGRFKNILIRRGAVIMLAVPTTGSGTNLRFTRTGPSFSAWLNYASSAGGISFRIDADLSTCTALREPDADANPMTEGELLLF